jgi:hypothetical protein
MQKTPPANWRVGSFFAAKPHFAKKPGASRSSGRGRWVAACPQGETARKDYFVVIAMKTCSVVLGPWAISLWGSLGAA